MRIARLQWWLFGAMCCLPGSAVEATKKGAGSSGSNLGSRGSSNGSGSGEQGDYCSFDPYLAGLYASLPSHLYTTSPPAECWVGDKRCAGPYYVGKTTVEYRLDTGQGEHLRNESGCGIQGSNTTSREVLLGVAALGPQYDIDGLTNTFILGFDAFRPAGIPVNDDVDPNNWSGCYSFPWIIHFATTSRHQWNFVGEVTDARDRYHWSSLRLMSPQPCISTEPTWATDRRL
ncbi:hypothetical protein N658DRAFT_486158 [Parathielavia hyrcaniae]|uniref:Uncharacterized protein n=1 Tax=Parathielavia hyrcaniae TaxID=113614 RepID=A0AAN6Q125_9PEZI|nr:hypothetical protein N658DRAFT_486158 [Parathielavia hyrcaniae]